MKQEDAFIIYTDGSLVGPNVIKKAEFDPSLGEMVESELQVTMREYGMPVMTRRRHNSEAPDEVMNMVQEMAGKFEKQLIENCKILVIRKPEVREGSSDVFGRYRTVGWYAQYGSPQLDFFERFFACKQNHSSETIRGCLSNLGRVLKRYWREKVLRRRDPWYA